MLKKLLWELFKAGCGVAFSTWVHARIAVSRVVKIACEVVAFVALVFT